MYINFTFNALYKLSAPLKLEAMICECVSNMTIADEVLKETFKARFSQFVALYTTTIVVCQTPTCALVANSFRDFCKRALCIRNCVNTFISSTLKVAGHHIKPNRVCAHVCACMSACMVLLGATGTRFEKLAAFWAFFCKLDHCICRLPISFT